MKRRHAPPDPAFKPDRFNLRLTENSSATKVPQQHACSEPQRACESPTSEWRRAPCACRANGAISVRPPCCPLYISEGARRLREAMFGVRVLPAMRAVRTVAAAPAHRSIVNPQPSSSPHPTLESLWRVVALPPRACAVALKPRPVR